MATITTANKDLLVVQDLKKYFPVRSGLLQKVTAWVKAVDGVSFTVREGETLGLVGESGCGKTTIGRTILRLTPYTGGTTFFDGEDVFAKKGAELKALRRNMQIVFQDPYSSLDPRMPVGEIIGEGLADSRHRDQGRARRDRDPDAGQGRAEPLSRPPVSARVLRRAAAAHRHRPRPGAEPAVHRLRRAGVGAGRLDPVAGAQPAEEAAG